MLLDIKHHIKHPFVKLIGVSTFPEILIKAELYHRRSTRPHYITCLIHKSHYSVGPSGIPQLHERPVGLAVKTHQETNDNHNLTKGRRTCRQNTSITECSSLRREQVPTTTSSKRSWGFHKKWLYDCIHDVVWLGTPSTTFRAARRTHSPYKRVGILMQKQYQQT
jgi:hypothetical protein